MVRLEALARATGRSSDKRRNYYEEIDFTNDSPAHVLKPTRSNTRAAPQMTIIAN